MSWPLRQLARLDRPTSVIAHRISGPSCVEQVDLQLTEAGRKQGATFELGSPQSVSLKNPLGEAVQITMAWSEERPGVLVETHRNTITSRRDAQMYRYINDRGQMVMEMAAPSGARARRVFDRAPVTRR